VEHALRLLSREIPAAIPAALTAARHPAATAARVVQTAASIWRTVAPISTTLSPIMTERHLTRRLATIDVPLDRLHAAAKAADCTINDAFLASIAAGLRHYHDKHGATVGELRVTLPISIRKEDDPIGGNRITLQRCTIPVGIDDHVDRMRAIHDRVSAVRAEPSLAMANEIAAGLNLLPPSYVGGILKHVDFLASNVPGPPFPIYLAGARLTGYHAFGPTIGASVNLTLLSYCGTCNVGVNIDTAAVPEPDVLMAALSQGFDDVLALAT
jgi:diacylglycerol O-acyltransferase / wax synthase